MKLSDIKPNTVYRITVQDSDSAASTYYGRTQLFAATGPELEIEKNDVSVRGTWRSATSTVRMVRLHPLVDAPVRQYRWDHKGYVTIEEPELRRGLSIIGAVCSVEEWLGWRQGQLTAQAEAQAEREAVSRELHDLETRLEIACEAVGMSPRFLAGVVRVNPDTYRLVEILEQAAKTEGES